MTSTSDTHDLPDFSRGPDGLLPAIAQDSESGMVLMIAWMNRESFEESLRTGKAVYYSRSRKRLWRKGEESGHEQQIVSIQIDCDADAILLQVIQKGAACHEGYRSCFFRTLDRDQVLVNQPRLASPEDIYKAPSAGTR